MAQEDKMTMGEGVGLGCGIAGGIATMAYTSANNTFASGAGGAPLYMAAGALGLVFGAMAGLGVVEGTKAVCYLFKPQTLSR